MMNFASLSPEQLDKIRACRWDGIIEKHEGPEDWVSMLEHYDLEFLEIDSLSVLLPVSRERHKNISILRSIVSSDGNSLTVFLKDTTNYPDPEDELFWTGRMAVCDRVKGEEFFLAIVFHEWFVIENSKELCVETHGFAAQKPRSTASQDSEPKS